MVVITAFFSWIRPYNSVVYAPKLKHADSKHAPPAIGKGLFAWFGPVAKTRESQMVEKVGLDGAVFLRFTRMCRNILLVMSIIGCGILLPANIIGSKDSTTGGSISSRAFIAMTPAAVTLDTLWAHVVCSWLFDIIVAYFLWTNYRAITRLRRQYFESPEYQMSLHSRTLWVTQIPRDLRTDEGIIRILDNVGQSSTLPRAAIGRNVKILPDLIEEHNEAVRNLESVLAKYLKNPDRLPAKRPTMRPSKKDRSANGSTNVDAIEYLTGRIRSLELEIKEVRESVDKRNAMPYGFAIYDHIEQAHIVAYNSRNKHPQGTDVRLAPKPNDLIWNNLPLTRKSVKWKRFWNNLWIVVLTLVWIAPNALIAIFLSNLGNLGAIWPGFQKNLDAHHTFWAAVQAIASPALTSLVYLLLPIMFRRMSIHAGDTTKTSRERHVTTKLYAFFVFNNLVVFSLFSAVWSFVAAVITNKQDNQSAWQAIQSGDFYGTIVQALCHVSPFWVSWLLQRNLGAATDLAQLINLGWSWFARTFMSPTPRQTIEWTAPPPMDYASYYNYFLFYTTVAFCFGTLQPLVLPVTALYFCVDSWLKKYLLLYVFITKTESGGRFWRILFNRIIFAIVLANLVTALVITATGNVKTGSAGGENPTSWVMLGVIAPLPFLMIGFKIYCARTFDDQCQYYNKATLKDQDTFDASGKKPSRHDRVGVKFGHPALFKPLITPMVHAKAQHVLSQVYHGRLENDNTSSEGFSDIAMDSMSHSQPGKSARFANGPPPAAGDNGMRDMFEMVPESHLDFAYYKNRAEFGDERGGDGELYGRPLDLVSERSRTPHSFRTGSNSNPSSRASSPAPSVPIRQQRMDELAFHPAYRDATTEQQNGLYNGSNESESRLLRGAQPVGMSRDIADGGDEREQFSLDRWRTGGSGYTSVPGTVVDEDEAAGYEAYRPQR